MRALNIKLTWYAYGIRYEKDQRRPDSIVRLMCLERGKNVEAPGRREAWVSKEQGNFRTRFRQLSVEL